MYDGIYVKDFILFFGEKVQYYILESQTADGQIGASGCLGNGDIMEEGSGDRYAWLNEMLLACTLDDREKLAGKMKRYYGMTWVSWMTPVLVPFSISFAISLEDAPPRQCI